jgi:hypothetical protein
MKLSEFLEAVSGDARNIVWYETEAVKRNGDALRL